jgi:hypothetical protein
MKRCIALVGLLLFGCNAKKTVDIIPYYDLSAQLRSHIQAMFKENAYLIKYVTYNGKPDQIINRKPDWNKELDPFFEADIHAPALLGLYTVDTTFAEDSTLKITYKTSDVDATVQTLTVVTDKNGALMSFDAEMRSGSMMSNIKRTLHYERFREFGYHVKEDNKYVSDNEYTVIGEVHMSEEYFTE